jgi:hypothetical protein
MEVEYEVSPADKGALQRYHQKHPPAPWPWWHWLPHVALCGVLVLGVFGYLYLLWIPSGIFWIAYFQSLTPGLGAGVILALIGLTLYGKLQKMAVRSPLNEGRNREKTQGWRRLAIDADGIHVTTAFAYSLNYWEGVDAVGASEDHIFLYITTRNAHVVPRRAFPDDRAFDEFLEAARRYHRISGIVHEGAGGHPAPVRRRSAAIPPPAAVGDAVVARTPPQPEARLQPEGEHEHTP